MKRILSLIAALCLAGAMTQAQVLIARWTFPTGTPADSLADGGLPVNLDKAIHTEGGTSAIDFSKTGASTKAAQATGWDNGASLKSWVVSVNTEGYENLKVSSKMQSGLNNPGPRDFKLQFRPGSTGDWNDVPVAAITVTNDWNAGMLDSISLPADCNGQTALYLRWIMTSNTNSQGGTVEASGVNKIDDIYMTGKAVSTGIQDPLKEVIFSLLPNPSDGQFVLQADEAVSAVTVFNSRGQCVFTRETDRSKRLTLRLEGVTHGIYFLKIRTYDGREGNRKLVIF